jgi:hypothetical protein
MCCGWSDNEFLVRCIWRVHPEFTSVVRETDINLHSETDHFRVYFRKVKVGL